MARVTLPSRWSRVHLVSVQPSLNGGRWPIKRTPGETVTVKAGLVIDGHDIIAAELVTQVGKDDPSTYPMAPEGNDVYTATFKVDTVGRMTYQVRAWTNRFATWRDQFERRVQGGVKEAELKSELLDGADLLTAAAKQAKGDDKKKLQEAAKAFKAGRVAVGLDPNVATLAEQYDPRADLIESDAYEVHVDPEVARFGAWYEFFPRSAGDTDAHATLDEAAERLPRIKEMGYDIVYLPPIHPIGEAFRKGKDNNPTAEPGEPGSPWAIGGKQADGTLGGHKSVHPELGGMEAFERFVAKAEELGLNVALDVAFQTSPDHPYVKDHPEWFKHRPDGTIRYAENPPKKYQDVYPFNFETDEWKPLWKELRSVFEFWIGKGVTIFRVDNPHTKPLAFWEWCLGSLQRKHPETIFLAEAFTKPKMMYALAKLGFNNSYTYFTWRNTKQELISYVEELTQTEVAEFYRPNFWPNTPDILHEYLVHGGRPAHQARFVLATTLSSCYGVYGPPYEHVDNNQHPDREEYANNEKYEVRTWNWNDPRSLQPFMQRVNGIRKNNPALQHSRNITFCTVENPQLIAYVKEHGDNRLLIIVNLDPNYTQSGWVQVPGMDGKEYQVHDLLFPATYHWSGRYNYVELNPHDKPAHIFRIEHP